MISNCNKVAVIICNWNKKDDVLKCIESVKTLNYDLFDIIVVDNASTDGSADAISSIYPDVSLIRNLQNLGGSGGFNTGMRKALEDGTYTYLYLLDNDVIVEPDTLSKLIEVMNTSENVGIVGSKIYNLFIPNQIQELGAWIDWKNVTLRPHLKGIIENTPINEVFSVDYVPACSLLVRDTAVRKAGLMDEGFFLYWDDIEWAHRIKTSGYSVMATGESKVWHKFGSAIRTTTMVNYYFWRNRLRFFMTNLQDEEREIAMLKYFEDFFQGMYTNVFYHKKQTARSMFEAVKDALAGNTGKAENWKFGAIDEGRFSFTQLVEKNKIFYILKNTMYDEIITILKRKFIDLELLEWNGYSEMPQCTLLIPCTHVFELEQQKFDQEKSSYTFSAYRIDKYLNLLPCNKIGEKARQRYFQWKTNFFTKYLAKLKQSKEVIK